ncbi:HAD hydrolase-like protein [Candidatus Vampirococcus lugosii]|uniref:HAD phosphatase family IIIA n=1 Tax=Candidatus Vampirococcus lugosii TaxID=2789015 RepID=A0ABS5QL14_9BACT|nr:HAD hydrolase-like protein [Candidatus Vampirococcus lugosii]MBS8121915.1 hAD phosphatase family IIIA [Candidatus Vampirococcus lugosii]
MIIFDIDNTLAHHGENPSEEIENLFQEIYKIGLKTLLFSDNSTERINQFCKNIDSSFVAEANKPNIYKLINALENFKLLKEQSIYISDQIFRDICMTNQAGIKSILVKYLRKPNQKKRYSSSFGKFYFMVLFKK